MENIVQDHVQKGYDEMLGFKIDMPVLVRTILALEGTEVTITDI
ncbi:MAG: hypothetical protein R2825_00950 [Saprospiraceae bacterium]